MDSHTLAEVMGNQPGVNYAALLPGYENAARAAQINNVNRAAMWAAQLGHESVGLRHMEEIASGTAYNGRQDLGNIYPGDGPRFKGRGPIQLTGRNNYRAFTRWAQAEGHSEIDFEANPHRLSEPHWGFLAATYYWTVARPDLNKASDAGDVLWASRLINGWVQTPNGLSDRRARFNRALPYGNRLLPDDTPPAAKAPHEFLMGYSRKNVTQLTPWNCGPASVETAILAVTGNHVHETQLADELGTHRGGTDWIGQFPAVLNRHIPGAEYRHVEMPNDPPTVAQKEKLWDDLTSSINAGHPVILNIVAPPNNYPRSVAPSTIDLAYSGGTIYHYVAAMNYAGTGLDRRVWWADSGFSPFGAWISFDQTATLIPPKGYAYSTAPPLNNIEEKIMTVLSGVSAEALNDTKLAAQEARDILKEPIGSLINGDKEFHAKALLALIDRQGWESGVLERGLFYALGLDPRAVIDAAVEADNNGENVDAAIRRALNLKGA